MRLTSLTGDTQRLETYADAQTQAAQSLTALRSALLEHATGSREGQYPYAHSSHVAELALRLRALHQWFTEG